jgi:hypothetical protein
MPIENVWTAIEATTESNDFVEGLNINNDESIDRLDFKKLTEEQQEQLWKDMSEQIVHNRWLMQEIDWLVSKYESGKTLTQDWDLDEDTKARVLTDYQTKIDKLGGLKTQLEWINTEIESAMWVLENMGVTFTIWLSASENAHSVTWGVDLWNTIIWAEVKREDNGDADITAVVMSDNWFHLRANVKEHTTNSTPWGQNIVWNTKDQASNTNRTVTVSTGNDVGLDQTVRNMFDD